VHFHDDHWWFRGGIALALPCAYLLLLLIAVFVFIALDTNLCFRVRLFGEGCTL